MKRTFFGSMKRMVMVGAMMGSAFAFAQGTGTAGTGTGDEAQSNHAVSPSDKTGNSAGTTYNNGRGATASGAGNVAGTQTGEALQNANGMGGSGDDMAGEPDAGMKKTKHTKHSKKTTTESSTTAP